jgi:hypothetical protein
MSIKNPTSIIGLWGLQMIRNAYAECQPTAKSKFVAQPALDLDDVAESDRRKLDATGHTSFRLITLEVSL